MLGNNLREIRKQRQLSQEALGELIGTSHAMISRYENDLSTIPLYRLEQIAKALDCTVVDLICDDFDKNIAKNTLNVKLMQHIIKTFLNAMSARLKVEIPSQELSEILVELYNELESLDIANDDNKIEGYVYGKLSGKAF